MNHQESDIKIYQTTDYDRFRMINGNRPLNHKKIAKILKEIKEGNDMLRYKPIEVSECDNFLNILDGQHRMFISRKLKAPVYYIIVEEEKTMNEIATINSNVEKWKYADFINCYINKGNENYVRLQNFLNLYHISIGTSLLMLSKKGIVLIGGSNSQMIENFYKGNFEIKFWDEAVEIAERARLFSFFKNWNDRYFMNAVNQIHKAGKIKTEVVVEACKRNPDKLERQTSTRLFIYNLEQIVGIGKKDRVIIA